ncbi:Glucans biosynthesis glucosyltransferase H [Castellaniella defragrans]
MQYFHFLTTPGLKLTSRVQLCIAIGMYLAQAAWILMIATSCIGSMAGDFRFQDLALGMALFVGVFFLSVAPKLFGALDVCLSKGGATRYGGRARFCLSALMEFLSSTLMAPIVALSVTLFLIGLVFGKSVSWGGQNRDQMNIPWHSAILALAPHTLAGLALAMALWQAGGWNAVLWGLPILTGLALAVPYTVLSAQSAIGRWLARLKLFNIPEERRAPPILRPPAQERPLTP